MKNLLLPVILLLTSFIVNAQEITQTIRGTVHDIDTKGPLISATVAAYQDSTLIKGTAVDANGDFRLEDLAVGRYHIHVAYLGYKGIVLPNIIVNSGKEVFLSIELEESSLGVIEVEVSVYKKKGESINEMTSVSSRMFSVEETERYAGSRGDPARMASNFAGVQGNDDSSNDIISRGNSPLGVLWRLEGVNIPNPNHFGVSGTTGGPVAILNNKLLSNSDFLTGAFPAEYGNSNAAVFDLKMRNGNNERTEGAFQWGFLGTEALVEGPFSKDGKSSYLFNYRYSTISIFHFLGIDIGTDATPRYQDASFKINLISKKSGYLSFFGIGGISDIEIIKSTLTDTADVGLYGDDEIDEYFGTKMGVLGMNYLKTLGDKSYMKLTLSTTYQNQHNLQQKIHRSIVNGEYVLNKLTNYVGYDFNLTNYSVSYFVNSKLSAKHLIKAGFMSDLTHVNLVDSIFQNIPDSSFHTRLQATDDFVLIQPYVQWTWRATDRLNFNTGIHGQILTLNGSTSLEPRLGMKWEFLPNNTLSAGIGMHSQMIPTYVYFAEMEDINGNTVAPNKDLDFQRSNHLVIGYNRYLNSNFRLKLETYYQALYNIPVTYYNSYYSLLNEGWDLNRFYPDSLTNSGTGANKGIEMTLEKFFNKGWFGMVTASLSDASYKGSNKITNTSIFNAGHVVNALGGKEFTWGKKNRTSFGIGSKVTWAGGRRYTPVDTMSSRINGYTVYFDSLTNSKQFRDYFRFDVKLNYKINTKKVTHEIGIDLVNLTGQENILKLVYTNGSSPTREVYQLGFLPIFYYKIDFSLKKRKS